ncbi:MAG: glycoside hydrolase family 3 N-terminal domain-containing protein [Acidimicrobiales bacterium]
MAPTTNWSPAQLVDQLLLVTGGFADLAASTGAAQAGIGGFVLMGQPAADSAATITAGLAALRAAAFGAGPVAPWFATDEEGGDVQRLSGLTGALPSPRQMAAGWTVEQTVHALTGHGRALAALGITMDLAPVLDVASPLDTVADEATRSFGDDPAVVARYGVAFAQGLVASSVVPVVKHFPGLGGASADTDLGPAVDPPLGALSSSDLVPFERAVQAGIPVVMVGHPVVPGLSGGLPASLSPATYRLLRQIGFAGVAITDSLDAGAIGAAGYTEPQAAVAALAAGADMVMVDGSSWQQTAAAVLAALYSGRLSATMLATDAGRVVAAKGLPVCLV